MYLMLDHMMHEDTESYIIFIEVFVVYEFCTGVYICTLWLPQTSLIVF